MDNSTLSINCRGTLLHFDVPKVMGILNITPNSFHDGGQYLRESQWLGRVGEMLDEGASIIDIGGYSSQPGADFVSEEEELQRVLPVVKSIVKHFPGAIISVDTFRAKVAEEVIASGAGIINDISAGRLDAKMMEVAGKNKVPYIMMHMKGTPQDMQQFTTYEDLMKEMMFYFSERVAAARASGIKDILLDPGFGFAKTLDQNYELLHKLDLLQMFGLPVLSALSRKSMIYRFLETTAEFALNGTSVLHTISLIKGAQLLRVHDVKEAVECIQLVKKTYEK